MTASDPSNLLTKEDIEHKIKHDPQQTKHRLNHQSKGVFGHQRMGHDNSAPTFANLTSPAPASFGRGVYEDDSDTDTPRRKTVTHRSRSSNNFNEDDFDFAIVLSPSAEYALWASELDFRTEVEQGWDGIRIGVSVGLDSDNKKVFLQKQTCFEAAVDTPQNYDEAGFISPNSKKIKWGSQLTSPSIMSPSGDAGDDLHEDLEAGMMKSVSSPPLKRVDYSDSENVPPNITEAGSGKNSVQQLKEKMGAIERKGEFLAVDPRDVS